MVCGQGPRDLVPVEGLSRYWVLGQSHSTPPYQAKTGPRDPKTLSVTEPHRKQVQEEPAWMDGGYGRPSRVRVNDMETGQGTLRVQRGISVAT